MKKLITLIPRLLVTAIFIYPCLSAFSTDLSASEFDVPSIRFSALGGRHAALADDFETLFANPAGFVKAGPVLSVSHAGLGLTGPVFTLAGLVLQGMNSSGGITSILQSDSLKTLSKSFHIESSLSGPLQFGFVGQGLGFGLFNTTHLIMESTGALLEVRANMREQLLLNGGYAVRLPLPASTGLTLDVGLLFKGFINGDIILKKNILALVQGGLEQFSSSPFNQTSGIGIDAGLLFSAGSFFSLGIVGRNIYTPVVRTAYTNLDAYTKGTETGTAENLVTPLDLSAGILITPPLGNLDRYITGLKFMLDYKDIVDFAVSPALASHPILHAGVGIEVSFVDIFDFRIGFNQGLFGAGFGMNLTWFTFNASMYGRELSHEPGMKPIFNMALSFDFRY